MKFVTGDKIREIKRPQRTCMIGRIEKDRYECMDYNNVILLGYLYFKDEKKWEKIENEE